MHGQRSACSQLDTDFLREVGAAFSQDTPALGARRGRSGLVNRPTERQSSGGLGLRLQSRAPGDVGVKGGSPPTSLPICE